MIMSTTTTPSETLAVHRGDLGQAEIRIAFGGGDLVIGQAPAGMLATGTCEGGVIQRFTASGALKLEPPLPPRWLTAGRPIRWSLGLTGEIPVDLRLETGANRSTVDLSSLRIRRLDLHTGASETVARLPAGGRTDVRVECGFASVTLDVPAGVAARIRSTMALGTTRVDEVRFPKVAAGWASPDFDAAANRVDVAIQGGFGAVQVR
jgi:hypothetical protein